MSVRSGFWILLLLLCVLAVPAQAGLVGHWDFDGDLADSANGHNATFFGGTATYDAGQFGDALYFDGIDDFVEVADEPAFDIFDTLTVSFWVKTEGGLNDDWQNIIAKGHDQGWEFRQYGNTDSLTFSCGNSNSPIPNSMIADDQWHHVVGVYDNTGAAAQQRVYVDGGLREMRTNVPAALPNTDTPVGMGAYAPSGQWPNDLRDHHKGWMDEVAIFDHALASNQVRALHAGTDPASLPEAEVSGPVEHVGNETATGPGWRTDSVAKPLDIDGDNVYGTDGWKWFGWEIATDTGQHVDPANPAYDRESLPDYIASVSVAGRQWCGQNEFGLFDDPLNPGQTRRGSYAYSPGAQSVAIERASEEAFRLTVFSSMGAPGSRYVGGVPLEFLQDITVTVGDNSSTTRFNYGDELGVQGYAVFDIPAGVDDVLLTLSNQSFDQPGLTGIAFDVPEPGTVTLLGVGLMILAGYAGWRRRRAGL